MANEIEVVSSEQHKRETGLPVLDGYVVARLKDSPRVSAMAETEKQARWALALMLSAQAMKQQYEKRRRRHFVN